MTLDSLENENLPTYLQNFNVSISSKGKIFYSTVGLLPSEDQNPLWELSLSGELEPNKNSHVILYNFSELNLPLFETEITGTLTICGKVLDARKEVKLLAQSKRFIFYLRELKIHKPTIFSWNIFLRPKTFSVNNEVSNILIGTVIPTFNYDVSQTVPTTLPKGFITADKDTVNFSVFIDSNGECVIQSEDDNVLSCKIMSPNCDLNDPFQNFAYFLTESTDSGITLKIPNLSGLVPFAKNEDTEINKVVGVRANNEEDLVNATSCGSSSVLGSSTTTNSSQENENEKCAFYYSNNYLVPIYGLLYMVKFCNCSNDDCGDLRIIEFKANQIYFPYIPTTTSKFSEIPNADDWEEVIGKSPELGSRYICHYKNAQSPLQPSTNVSNTQSGNFTFNVAPTQTNNYTKTITDTKDCVGFYPDCKQDMLNIPNALSSFLIRNKVDMFLLLQLGSVIYSDQNLSDVQLLALTQPFISYLLFPRSSQMYTLLYKKRGQIQYLPNFEATGGYIYGLQQKGGTDLTSISNLGSYKSANTVDGLTCNLQVDGLTCNLQNNSEKDEKTVSVTNGSDYLAPSIKGLVSYLVTDAQPRYNFMEDYGGTGWIWGNFQVPAKASFSGTTVTATGFPTTIFSGTTGPLVLTIDAIIPFDGSPTNFHSEPIMIEEGGCNESSTTITVLTFINLTIKFSGIKQCTNTYDDCQPNPDVICPPMSAGPPGGFVEISIIFNTTTNLSNSTWNFQFQLKDQDEIPMMNIGVVLTYLSPGCIGCP